MKRNYLMIGALTGTMLLAGCSLSDFGLGNEASEDNNKSSQTDKSNKDSNSKSDNSTNDNKKNNDVNSVNSVKDLNQAEKVALALSDDSVSNVAITANDLKRHSYIENSNTGKKQQSIDKYELQATGEELKTHQKG